MRLQGQAPRVPPCLLRPAPPLGGRPGFRYLFPATQATGEIPLQRSRRGSRPLLGLLLGILVLGGSARASAGSDPPGAGTSSATRTSQARLPSLDELIALHRLAGARISLLIVDARSGAVIAARAPDELLPPASTAKLLTAEAALEVLGPEHRFTTELLATGPVANGVLRGDLVLRGGGDPNLQVPDLLELAGALARAGIRRVDGRLVVDDSLLAHPPSIGADDFPPNDAYNAGIGALTVGFDRVRLRWRRDPDGSGDVLAWTVPPLAEAGIALAPPRSLPRGAVASDTDAKGRSTWLLAPERSASGSTDLPVRDSGLQAGALFRAFSARLGVRLPPPVRGTPTGPLQRLAAHESRPLVEMLGDMLRYSNNQMAELIGLATSRRLVGHSLELEQFGRGGAGLSRRRDPRPGRTGPGSAQPFRAGRECPAHRPAARGPPGPWLQGPAGRAVAGAAPADRRLRRHARPSLRRCRPGARRLGQDRHAGRGQHARRLSARPQSAAAHFRHHGRRRERAGAAAAGSEPFILRARALEDDLVRGWLAAGPG